MPRLSRTQEVVRRQIAQLEGRGLLSAPLGKRLLGFIQAAVPADGQVLFSVDPVTLLYNRVIAQSPGMKAHTPWFFQHRYLQEGSMDDLVQPNLMRDNLSVVIVHERPETSWGIPARILNKMATSAWYRAYHELSAPNGGLLRAFFSIHGQWIAALELIRFEPIKPFQPTDGAFLRVLAPIIGRLLSSAFAHERALASHAGTGTDASGILLLTPNGQVIFRTQAAEMWINRLQQVEGSLVSHLPTAVWSALARLQALPTTENSIQAIVRVPTFGGMLRVEASRGSEDDFAAVMLLPERRSLFPDLPLAWPLTGQEKHVFRLLVQGLSNTEIASILIVTENTVETHLRHIYEKLDVHTRNELLARFFHETYGPLIFQ
jgi:DNA-binding CsgD family transcriptional regulator